LADIRLAIATDAAGSVAAIREVAAQLDKTDKAAKETKQSLAGAFSGEIEGRMQSLSGSAGGLGNVLAGLGPHGLAAAAGIGAAVASLGTMASLVNDLAQAGGALADLSAKAAISTDALQEYAYAGSMVGLSTEQIANSVTILGERLASGGKEVEGAMAGLGLSLAEINAMKPEDQFRAIATAIQGLAGPGEQAAAAMALFGKSGRELLPLIRSDFVATAAAAHDLGLVLSADTVGAADKLGDSMDTASQQVEKLKQAFATAILNQPEVQGAFNSLIGLLSDLIPVAAKATDVMIGLAKAVVLPTTLIPKLTGEQGAAAGLAEANAKSAADNKAIFEARAAALQGAAKLEAVLKEAVDKTAEADRKAGEAAAKRAAAEHAAFLKTFNIRHDIYDLANMGPRVEEQTIYNLLEESRKRAAALTQGPAESMDYDKMRELLRAIEDQTADVVAQTTDWRGVLDEVANIFQVLGISASSAFGKVLGGLSAGMAGLQRAKEIGGISIVKNEGGKTNWGQTFASLGAGMQIVGSAVSIGKAIIGLFKSDPVKKAQKQAGQALGVGISRELAEAIMKQAKSLHISVQLASLLNISGAMAESGKDPRSFAGQITSLMQAIKDGSVPAAQGLEELGKSFTAVADAALKAGSVGDKALVGIIKNARAMGIESPEIKAFVSEQLAAAAAGIGKMGGLQIVTAQDAEAQALIFSTVFWATVKEKGILGAADAFKESFAGLSEKLKASGFDVSAIFGPIEQLMGLAGNETFRGAAEGAQGLKEALEGVANAGYLTAQSFAAFGQQAGAAYQQALAGGASDLQALQTIAPLLGSIMSASRNYGFTIDANTQALIDQAKAAGIAFPTEPMERVANLLGLIAEKMGATADEIARATGNMDEFGNSVGAASAEVGAGSLTPAGGGRSTGGPAGNTTITINYSPSTQIEGAGNEQTVLQFVTEGLRNNADGLRSLVEGLARGAF
jgi:hypothetical protein